MRLKKMFAAANCLALLLALAVRAEAMRAGPARFNSATPAAASQRRRVRRGGKRRMSVRAKEVRVQEGVWGGEHVRMVVREGGADVEFDCAHGQIGATLQADADGRFDLPADVAA